jgi:hypothetical protein
VDISHKDIVITLTGASAALSGLVLVFLGVLVAAYQPLIGPASNATLLKYRQASYAALGVFFVSLASVVVDTLWMVGKGGHCFFVAVVVLFLVHIAALAGLAWYSTVNVLLKA